MGAVLEPRPARASATPAASAEAAPTAKPVATAAPCCAVRANDLGLAPTDFFALAAAVRAAGLALRAAGLAMRARLEGAVFDALAIPDLRCQSRALWASSCPPPTGELEAPTAGAKHLLSGKWTTSSTSPRYQTCAALRQHQHQLLVPGCVEKIRNKAHRAGSHSRPSPLHAFFLPRPRSSCAACCWTCAAARSVSPSTPSLRARPWTA